MTNINDEQFSACIDGEASTGETRRTIDALISDPQLRQRWWRYHLVGDAIRSDLDNRANNELADRIRKAIDAEPVVLAPQRSQREWFKPLAGLAIAASVAAVAVIGVQSPEKAATESIAPQVARVEPAAVPAPVLVEQTVTAPVRWANHRPVVKSRLNSYLVNHNEHSATGVRGMLPYAIIIVNEAPEK